MAIKSSLKKSNEKTPRYPRLRIFNNGMVLMVGNDEGKNSVVLVQGDSNYIVGTISDWSDAGVGPFCKDVDGELILRNE